MDLQKIISKYKSQADVIGIHRIHEKTTVNAVRNEKFDSFSRQSSEGLLIEVLKNGHIGYAGTSETSLEAIDACILKALKNTSELSTNKVEHFESTIRTSAQGTYESPRTKDLSQFSQKQLFDVLMAASGSLNSRPEIINRVAYAMIVETKHEYVNSLGAEINQNFQMVNTNFAATAEKNNQTQNRTDNGSLARCYQIGAEFFDVAGIQERCRTLSEEAYELLLSENCPTETMDVILAPDQMILQIHESIGHPLELDRILGDERNYAGWSFVKKEDFGNLQYGAELMNVTFDPTVPNELASYNFDACGKKAEKKYLIQNGKLLRGLGSLESEARLKSQGFPIEGVANFRTAGWNRAPLDRMANLNLEPGEHSLEQMISSVERGVLMRSNRSWSIDDYRNKFQFGCEYAQMIENGKITRTLKNPNYRGITVPFWKSLKMLSKEMETYGSPYCGKGEPSQVIRVGHRSPYSLFSKIEVFGGIS